MKAENIKIKANIYILEIKANIYIYIFFIKI